MIGAAPIVVSLSHTVVFRAGSQLSLCKVCAPAAIVSEFEFAHSQSLAGRESGAKVGNQTQNS